MKAATKKLPPSRVPELLSELGDTAEEVAVSLLNAGCRGKRCESNDCPIANYLCKRLFEDCLIGVHATTVTTRREGDESDYFRSEHRMPAPCRDFVTLFDDGFFSALDKERLSHEPHAT